MRRVERRGEIEGSEVKLELDGHRAGDEEVPRAVRTHTTLSHFGPGVGCGGRQQVWQLQRRVRTGGR